MNRIIATVISIALVIALAVLTVSLDEGIDRDRLQEVSSIPNFKPPASQDVVVPDETTDGTEGKEGSEAPNFTVTDAQGNPVTLEQLRGKPVVLHFWATWVSSHARELAMFQQAYEEYQDTVHFVMVNTTSDNRETREKADQALSDGGFTFPAYYDLDASAANSYSVTSLPTTFFIDANGKAIAYAASELVRANLDLGLQYCEQSAAKAEQTTETTETTDTTENTEAA